MGRSFLCLLMLERILPHNDNNLDDICNILSIENAYKQRNSFPICKITENTSQVDDYFFTFKTNYMK